MKETDNKTINELALAVRTERPGAEGQLALALRPRAEAWLRGVGAEVGSWGALAMHAICLARPGGRWDPRRASFATFLVKARVFAQAWKESVRPEAPRAGHVPYHIARDDEDCPGAVEVYGEHRQEHPEPALRAWAEQEEVEAELDRKREAERLLTRLRAAALEVVRSKGSIRMAMVAHHVAAGGTLEELSELLGPGRGNSVTALGREKQEAAKLVATELRGVKLDEKLAGALLGDGRRRAA